VRRTANRRSSRPASRIETIRPSSTRCRPTGTTTPKVRRGDIYTAATRGAYSGKPRPVVVIQDDRFDGTASVTVVPFTTSEIDAPLLRIPVPPSDTTGLTQPGRLMVDKVTTVPPASLTHRVGRLSDADIVQLNRALLVFLGLAV
jgi:mRNA interferase MazF